MPSHNSLPTNPNAHPYPLHKIGHMTDDIRWRLAWAEEAIMAGHDVNELDGARSRRLNMGRPLHAALAHPGHNDVDGRFESIDLVRLLLAHGADPRLPCCRGRETPMDMARAERRRPENRGVRDFYDLALEAMEDAVDRIRREESARLGRSLWVQRFLSLEQVEQ